jgi:hypothetical protein
MESLFATIGAQAVDAHRVRMRHPARILNGWELKPYSVIHSQFEEVLLLDADNVPIQNPATLFESIEYLTTGAVFWPDFGRLAVDREIWWLTGVPYRDEPEFESGQLIINKTRCWKPLLLTMWMNEHSDFWYRFIHGDKETFHIAWRKLSVSYAMPEKPIQSLKGTMCQHDFSGIRMFQHRNTAKWQIRGNPEVRGFLRENECIDLLHAFYPHWSQFSGITLYGQAHKDGEELTHVESLLNNRWQYHRIGFDSRVMTFRNDGVIREGAADRERYWNITTDSRGLCLNIQACDSVTCRLRPSSNGIWNGCWEQFERMPIELRPIRTQPH